MLNLLDNFLDRITMYRVVLYVLIGWVACAAILSYGGLLSYSPGALILSSLFLTIVCWISNKILAFLFKAPTNVESVYITALILTFIITPMTSVRDIPFFIFAGVFAMASKYILAIKKKHLFNPAAIAVVLTAFILGRYASWWIGTAVMLPFVAIGGFLILKKLQKVILISVFLLGVIGITILFAIWQGTPMYSSVTSLFLDSAIVFFATVMLTEPLTSPPTKLLQVVYGTIVVLLIDPHIHVGAFYSSPELTLVVANIFSYIVSPKQKLLLHLKEKTQYGADEVEFVFASQEKLHFMPGQYMEWTLKHPSTDSRGNRRYFTVASSPTENAIHLGVKFYENGSSFKRALHHLSDKDSITVGSLGGEFTLPKSLEKKLVFIAGGIGITPFRSMIKYCIDSDEKRDIILMYSNKADSEIMYKNVFQIGEKIGVKTIYTLTDIDSVPKNWKGQVGRITPDMIRKEIPDFTERLFYLSGPHGMVVGFEKTLKEIGISQFHIKKDFFPGFV